MNRGTQLEVEAQQIDDDAANHCPHCQFLTAIYKAGLMPPADVKMDGKVRRFSSDGALRDRSGWYVFDSHGLPAGMFGDTRTGFSQTWRVDIDEWMDKRLRIDHKTKVVQ